MFFDFESDKDVFQLLAVQAQREVGKKCNVVINVYDFLNKEEKKNYYFVGEFME